ncbi:MAG TPA: hypothetical protein VLL54_17660 [Pyrinomonadaceae bacterium]|nr:hypothetical protein [Pyrinomonadaceae bacterium]
MSFTTIFIITGVVLLLIFVLIIKLAIRWVVKFTIIAVIIAALAGMGGFWWWSTKLVGKPKMRQPATPAKRSAR